MWSRFSLCQSWLIFNWILFKQMDNKEKLDQKEAPRQENETRKLTEVVRNFLSSAWCYGLPALVRSKTVCFRFMWSVAILFSACTCAFMIWLTMKEYLAYSVVTEIQSKENRSLTFPQITICGFYLSQPAEREEIYQVRKVCGNQGVKNFRNFGH